MSWGLERNLLHSKHRPVFFRLQCIWKVKQKVIREVTLRQKLICPQPKPTRQQRILKCNLIKLQKVPMKVKMSLLPRLCRL